MKSEQDKLVVGIGEVVWDIFPDGPHLGGAPANFVYYTQLLGLRSILITRVGEDELGKETLKQLSSHNMITDYIQVDKNHPTGTVRVELDSNGVPTFTIEQNVAWDYLEKNDILKSIAQQASAICFGSLAFRSSPSRGTIDWFLTQAKPDCLRVLDINLRPPFYSPELLDWLLRKADILKLNDGELKTIGRLFYPKLSGETFLCRKLISDYQIKLVALTKGEKGSLLITADKESTHPGFLIKVVDTVGAGDSFTAALVIGLLSGKELDRINQNANWLASRVCSQKGAWVQVASTVPGENSKLKSLE
ncbi:MAG TPA: carbohydrate kinase [Candidatus Aminicenantes bacterium]|nr:carbohydrate kinase [Candidatus Aminicenantes bacterium]